MLGAAAVIGVIGASVAGARLRNHSKGSDDEGDGVSLQEHLKAKTALVGVTAIDAAAKLATKKIAKIGSSEIANLEEEQLAPLVQQDDNEMLKGMKLLLDQAQENGGDVEFLKKIYNDALKVQVQSQFNCILAKAATADMNANRQKFAVGAVDPAMQILTTARNILNKTPPSMEGIQLAKLERFTTSVCAQVDEDQIESWLTNKLDMTKDIPVAVRQHMVKLTQGLRQQILDEMNFVYENGKGVVYKTSFMFQKCKGYVNIALVVFGASFNTECSSETQASKIIKEGTDGTFVDEDGNPVQADGVPAEDLKRFMDYLEVLASQQIWERASDQQKQAVGGIPGEPPLSKL